MLAVPLLFCGIFLDFFNNFVFFNNYDFLAFSFIKVNLLLVNILLRIRIAAFFDKLNMLSGVSELMAPPQRRRGADDVVLA